MLTTQQKRFLKAKAHALKPVIRVGQKGFDENVLAELNIALDAHELVKIKLAGIEKETRDALIVNICEQAEAEFVQSIGHVLVVFRQNLKNSKFELPTK